MRVVYYDQTEEGRKRTIVGEGFDAVEFEPDMQRAIVWNLGGAEEVIMEIKMGEFDHDELLSLDDPVDIRPIQADPPEIEVHRRDLEPDMDELFKNTAEE